jgi:RNA polymerase sigma-70 factor (ECF subfamily)
VADASFLHRIISSLRGEKGNKSDEELIGLFIGQRDVGAYEEILKRYQDKIYGLALRITRNPTDAEDILQEVFLTLTRKIDTFRGESKFSSWLYRIAVNASYMHLRGEKKHETDVSLEDYAPYDEKGTLMGRIASKDWADRPDKVLFSKEALDIIEKAVNQLPESYRVVFHLRDVEGLSNEEVAEILGLSIPAIKSRLHRGRLFLRDKLSDYFYEWSGGK